MSKNNDLFSQVVWLPAIASLAFPALYSPFAVAQRVLEEVVVSAQRIEQSVQDVPISIVALSSETLDNANVFTFEDTVALTPGISVNAGLQSSAIRIRGVGDQSFAVGAQSVPIYVDEVARAAQGSVFATLVDIERIELLRGPQSTLYGANAPGGAYNITTRNPDFEGLGGYIESSYSQFSEDSDLATIDVRGALNIPLVDDVLAARVAGVYADSDGYIKVENPVSPDDSAGGKDHKAIRAKLLWDVNERNDVTLSYDYNDLTDHVLSFNYDGLVPGTGGSNDFPATYNSFDDRESYAEFVSEVEGELDQYILHWRGDYDIGQMDLIYSDENWDTQSAENREPYPGSESFFGIQTSYDVQVFELRLSDTGELFDYVAGVYYTQRDLQSDIGVRIGAVDVLSVNDNETESGAVFANVNYHLTETWDVAAGARYEDTDLDLNTGSEFAGFGGSISDSQGYDNVSWSFKLRHFINDDTTAYLAIDNAYKSGGVNVLMSAASSDAFGAIFPVAAAQAEDALFYDEEDSTAYEIGIKGTALDSRLQYSVAVFLQEFDDLQITQDVSTPVALGAVGGLFAGSKTNAEEAETVGVEFDIRYLLGEHWDIAYSGAYADPTADQWSTRYCASGEESSPEQLFCPRDGDALTYFPKWTSYGEIGYRRPLAQGEMFARLNWAWQSEANFTTVTDEFSEDKHRFGFNAGVRLDNGLSLQVWGKNLTDEYYTINPSLQANGDPALPAAFEGAFDPGRELGVTLGYQF